MPDRVAAPTPQVIQPYSTPMQPYYSSYPSYAPSYRQQPTMAPISNRAAWFSFGFGVFALVISIVYSAANPNGWVFSTSEIVAIIWGIRALLRVRAGLATRRWPAVVGIVTGSIATALTVLVLLVHAYLLSLAGAGEPNLGSYPNNPEMTSMTRMAYQIEHSLRQHATDGAWPSALVVDPTGTVEMSDGTVLGTMATGWTFQYTSLGNGQTFEFTIHGNVAGEYVDYLSSTKEINGYCLKTDTSCFPDGGPPNQIAPSGGVDQSQANT